MAMKTSPTHWFGYVVEALAFLLIGAGLGLFLNAVRADGIDLGAPPGPVETDPHRIGLEEVKSLWRDAGAAIFVDARHKTAYDRGHIPDAFHLDEEHFDDPDTGWRRLTPYRGRPVVVYCDGATCGDSRAVARRLRDVGFRNVRVFTEGWAAWIGDNQPVQRTGP